LWREKFGNAYGSIAHVRTYANVREITGRSDTGHRRVEGFAFGKNRKDAVMLVRRWRREFSVF